MITRILMAMLVLLTLVFVTVSVAAPAVPTGESSLGDRVWNDANNNGTQDVGEVGIIGVKITLYVDDGDGVFDPGPNLTTNDQVDVETFLDGKTTTATNGAVTGYYNYDKITADGNEFFVVIDSTNFDPGGALEGFLFSSGATSAFIMEGVPGSVTDPLRMYVPTALGQFRIVIDTADFGFWKPELSLSITPGSATNKVGDPHTFTITVLERVNNAMVPNVGVKPTVTVRNAANTVVAPTSQTCSTTGTNASGQCTVTINSTVADVYTASANLSETYGTGGVNGTVTIDRTTGTAANATAGGTGTGTKTYVDLRISISPQSATNKVGDAHVFTVLVEQKIGTGAWTAVASGVKPTVVLSATPDSKTDLCTSPAAGTVGATGACTVTINHNSAGVFTANASVTLSVSGQSITRNTTGDTANAAALLESPARTGTGTKTYVDLRISISPQSATNKVGDAHVFTVLVEQKIGTGAWTAVASGVKPTVVLSATPDSKTDLCTSPAAGTVGATGACTVTINHNSAGVFTANASVTLSVSGQSITRNTTGDTANAAALLETPARTGTGTKTYVDLRISISPQSATNKVGDAHVFTVLVEQKIGTGAWTAVASGVKPTVVLSATPDSKTDLCTSPAAGTVGTTGACTVTINHNSAGVFTANASVTLSVSGQSITRNTTGDTANAAALLQSPARTGTGTKTYVDLRISISPQSATNKVGDAHVFTVLVEQKIGTGAWTAVASGVKPTVVLSATPDSKTDLCTSPAAGTVGATGACTVTINHNSAGVFTANASVTLSVSGQSITRNTTGDTANAAALLETPARTGTGTKTYVDLRISISPLTATNPVGAPHVFTVLVEQQIGTGIWTTVANGVQPAVTVSPTPNSKTDLCATTGTASGACIVTINHNFAATFTTNASVTVSVSGQSITRNTTGDTRNATALLQSPARTGTATKIYQAATLGDSVWWDIDKDGTQDSGEPGIPAVTVNLYVGASTTVYSTTQTNGSGIYQFQNLPNNSYRIEIPASEFSGSETLVSWFGSPLNTGGNTASTDLVDSDADPATHIISSVALGVGVTDNSNDFGFYKNTDYTITKTTNASGAQRLGDVISFTIQIHNNGTSYLAIAPLEDTYNKDFLEYVSASVAPNDPTNDGTLNWTNVLSSQLAPNGNFSINIFFKAVGDTTDITKVNPDMPNTRNVARLVLPFADPDGPAGPLGSLEPLTTKSANDIVQIINPTAVALAASQTTVDASSGVVTVGWQTVSETDIAGFNLSRTRGDGVTELVNSQLIPAQNSGQPTGSWYTVLDTQTSRGVTYTYTLQFIMADGRLTNHPLGSVFVGYTLYLPLVIR
ncbi:MAG: hypothetical protein KA003_05980 [Caldilineaceae bacterium]|nr:hypothetical protein [Caldilineaceae bacterium]